MDARLRFATTDEDKAAAYRLRYELYVEQQGLFGDEADHERRWLTDEYDERSHLLLAEVEGRLVGTARITLGMDTPFSEKSRRSYQMERFRGVVHERDMAVITRLVLRPEHRGGDLGFRLLEELHGLAAEKGMELILGNCELHLVNHYRKLGSRPSGELFNHETNGALVPIVAVLGDLDYLRRIGSPMLGALSRRTKPVGDLERILALVSEDVPVVSEDANDTRVYQDEVTRLLRDGEQLAGILDDLSREEAILLLDKSHILTCHEGDAIIRKGHVSRTLYMLVSGSLEVYDDGKRVARVGEPGSVVGEVAFFSSGPRMSDVVAGAGGARVLALSDRQLREIISEHGPVAAKFLHFVACGLSQKLLERSQAFTPAPEDGAPR